MTNRRKPNNSEPLTPTQQKMIYTLQRMMEAVVAGEVVSMATVQCDKDGKLQRKILGQWNSTMLIGALERLTKAVHDVTEDAEVWQTLTLVDE